MIDETNGRLQQELEFSKSIGNETLQNCLDNLDRANKNGRPGTETYVYCDFAPRSFYFVRKWGDIFMGNGGIIFYGPGNSGVGSPQFSVSIGGNKETRWEIHT